MGLAWHVAFKRPPSGECHQVAAVGFLVFVLSADLAVAVIVCIEPRSEAVLLECDIRKGEEADAVPEHVPCSG